MSYYCPWTSQSPNAGCWSTSGNECSQDSDCTAKPQGSCQSKQVFSTNSTCIDQDTTQNCFMPTAKKGNASVNATKNMCVYPYPYGN